MAMKTCKRLWSHLWEPAHPFFSPKPSRCHYSTTSHLAHPFSRTTSRPGFRSLPKPSARRSLTSCGLLFIDISPTTTVPTSPLTACTTIETPYFTTQFVPRQSISAFTQKTWRRELHTNNRRRERGTSRRNKSSTSNLQNGHKPPQDKKENAHIQPVVRRDEEDSESMASKYLQLPHMPKLPHRPSREELLAAATGFWSRLKVRFKWLTIRSARPWNVDDWSAFISWFVLGNIAWLVIGTTTFLSLVIYTVNTVVAQETLARWVGDYLTHSAGIKVVFESAIVPKWGDGVITFRNVFVSRRPGQGHSKVSKGSSAAAAAAAAAAERGADLEGDHGDEDTNYTQFDITIDTVNVTLSFVKWWNGKGLMRDVEVQGVRGVVDRRSVRWPAEYVDPRTYLHEHRPGDFEIDSFKMGDLLLTIHQPRGFRPFNVSIYTCELPQLRKQWLFYDFLSANNMSGSFDNSLFNIHPYQTHSSSSPQITDLGEASPWKKHSRLRIDGLKIDHLNRGVDGPFGWIHEGKVDIVADVKLPAETDDSIAKVMSDFYDRMEATVTSNRYLHILENHPRTADLNTPEAKAAFEEKRDRDDDKRFLVMDLRVHFNDVKAAVPLFTRDLSYVNQALIRPIVAYINAKRTFIPINCTIVKRVSEFDGSWTIFDSGLMEDLSAETYAAFAKDVMDSQARMRRLKKVGFWSISVAVHALFMGMAGNVA
ncbi:hypothetical protein BP5796_10432 [Coleophoma crateriformis]|uniref:Mitochondrial distribution and morphology protein 31 n=1 Tax=Coleophoma crateriformis TaxID=565419 RepID=A0A3D8QQK4_9HELO|nr:hypothetical protein BP5796_10432 [Coleophoma crateriformis]